AIHEFTGLVRSMQGLVTNLARSQERFGGLEKQLVATLKAHDKTTETLAADMDEIKLILIRGFRLHDD
ncbi:hypothetical protein QQ73_14775, partial [Candidatus Endoriftia persephone str. Guaymas]|nr:hypothetical protein [Candidatus Endoriftia persephone str. Guaymas]